ncbi:MAG: S9 family peptidase [Candidatus Aminicenantes bacterium]|nr:S9 family peptidase [Candidatus Aminicenantes bacterium]
MGLILSFATQAIAENIPVKKANYKLAERFSPTKLDKMSFSTSVSPHWLKLSERFWYVFETSEGKTFFIVDPTRKTKKSIFDNVKMAALLSNMTKDPYDAKHLPIDTIKFVDDEKAIYFKVNKNEDVLAAEKKQAEWDKKDEEKDVKKDVEQEEVKGKEKKEKEKSEIEKAKEEALKFHHFEYDLATGKLTLLEDFVDEPNSASWANISPDGETVLFGKHHNIFSMSKADYEKWLNNPDDETIEEVQLTTDGEENFAYHGGGRGENNVTKEKEKDDRKSVRVYWSHDSKKFASIRTDSRKVKDLWVINSVSEPRPTLETYKYQMPGEAEAPQEEMFAFDLASKEKTLIKAEAFKDQTLSIFGHTYPINTRDDRNRATMWISESPDKLYFERTSRDLKRIDTCVADTSTGEVTVLIEERLNTYVETRGIGFVSNGQELIHWSERDGWAHFYLYNGDGTLKNQITSGPFHCENIVGIDEKNRVLYFSANGREEGEDPYYLHLYRVNFDGTGLKLLNNDNFNHSISTDDTNKFFMDNFSRVNTVPVTVLLDSQGNKLLDLETADISLLEAAGFNFPEPFKVKAADGITDLYGVMYKPFDFDETLSYPIIAYVYPGPQTESVSKSFSAGGDTNYRLAQFGFIVITVGNRGGHPSRSKWYHNYGYGNLRDYGLADKKAAIEQLADRHAFINIDKVGIFGHSGGGFMSTAALLVYPDFFKVAVSSSGNHENNIYNRWWSEKHHGVDEIVDKDGNITFKYDIEKNSEVAGNLKGNLLITTGDIDNNVHPGNTIRLANALIKANKRFDFFLFPGQRHGYGPMNEYFFWLRADFFCKHLIGDYSQSVDIDAINRDIEKKR